MSKPSFDSREGVELRSKATSSADTRAVLAARAGDANAFGELVQRYQKRLFNLSLMVVRNPENAEEITQDAFIRAYTKLAQYNINRPFYPWLATISVRLAQTQLRKKQLELVQGVPDTVADNAVNPLEQLVQDENYNVWNIVTALSSGERTAVFLVYRQELTVAEAAGAIGVTTGTVKTLLFRARKHLRAMLDEQPERST